MKATAALLVLFSLAALLALPCLCVAEERAPGHGCCATRTSIQAADSCCPPRAEPPIGAAPFTVTAVPLETPATASFADPGAFVPRSPSPPRPIACARTPILRV